MVKSSYNGTFSNKWAKLQGKMRVMGKKIGNKCFCGMCDRQIKWKKDREGNIYPSNVDGSSHMLVCPFVSEARKRKITS